MINPIKTRSIKRTINGVDFTFECSRSAYEGFDGVTYRHKWYWGADVLNGRHVAIGGRRSLYSGIKHQIKAAEIQIMQNNRELAG